MFRAACSQGFTDAGTDNRRSNGLRSSCPPSSSGWNTDASARPRITDRRTASSARRVRPSQGCRACAIPFATCACGLSTRPAVAGRCSERAFADRRLEAAEGWRTAHPVRISVWRSVPHAGSDRRLPDQPCSPADAPGSGARRCAWLVPRPRRLAQVTRRPLRRLSATGNRRPRSPLRSRSRRGIARPAIECVQYRSILGDLWSKARY